MVSVWYCAKIIISGGKCDEILGNMEKGASVWARRCVMHDGIGLVEGEGDY